MIRQSNILGSLKLVVFAILSSFTSLTIAQPFQEISLQSKLASATNVNGVAVADYDNDNDLDVFVVTRYSQADVRPEPSKLFRNNNDGTFTDVTAESGINSAHDYAGRSVPGTHAFGEKMSASWGDYDSDGYVDLLLTNALFFELYHNNQDGTFTNVSSISGIPQTNSCYNTSATWFDYDNDSYLDIYTTTVFSCHGAIYHNNGDGTFTNTTGELGIANQGIATWMALPWDINTDGLQDLYVSVDFDLPNHFYLNNDSSFTDAAESFGLTDIGKDGMGLAQGDFNNDGLLDVYITNIDQSSLYKNLGNGNFQNLAEALQMDSTGWSWGCQFEDFDHDLDMDLVVLNGYQKEEKNFFFENLLETGIEKFVNRSADYGMNEPSFSNGLATFDYDNDGDLDILIGRTNKGLEFFENKASDSIAHNWVQFALKGTSSNINAIGTHLEVKVGGHTLTRYYHGASLMGQNQLPVHFGLAEFDTIDQLKITWPSGEVEVFENMKANFFYEITEKGGVETLILGSEKILGCTDPNSCNYNPDATQDDGSCTYLQSQTISGAASAGILSEQVYTYPGNAGSTYEWTVQNGEIIEGHSGATITVKWNVAEMGIVEVIEKGTCNSEKVTLPVTLTSDEMPENASVARMWNEVTLAAIRRDYARPTVHARNLFHTSIAMYDAWALFDDEAETYLIGKQLHNYASQFTGFETEVEKSEAVNKAISYAAYRLLTHRFAASPNQEETQARFDGLMTLLGYDPSFTSTAYSSGDPAALGNFIAKSVIEYGFIDGANEGGKYANLHYKPVNDPLPPAFPGNPTISDPNHWQPLQLAVFIDQAGNPTEGTTPDFLSPEWGIVHPFALKDEDSKIFQRDGGDYKVFHDPGTPPQIGQFNDNKFGWDLYKWNFSLVSVWSSHLDPSDGVMWDISPAGIGNIPFETLPQDHADFSNFHELYNGGDPSPGHTINPITNQPYQSQIVPRGDYTRVLAEFWADGPDSETPPGHWFVLLNYINDHPEFVRKFKGQGEIMDPLEWDVKAYFALGGTMHDAAVASWAIKGWYDYIRPVSAIRYMAEKGQSSDPNGSSYHQDGLPLIDNYIELVNEGDPLAGDSNQHVGKIKLLAWKGHPYVANTETDAAGVGWILAENWWPYQRPSFVTPPFAGYVSGHSTYSRAAAELITLLTGSKYFPGGMGEFVARKNEFLVFEEGPSQDVILQWATYQDASDQCSLSRIWGGIHPPADDIPGRIIGATIGKEAFAYAETYFNGKALANENSLNRSVIYPVPVVANTFSVSNTRSDQEFALYDIQGNRMSIKVQKFDAGTLTTTLQLDELPSGLYILRTGNQSWKLIRR